MTEQATRSLIEALGVLVLGHFEYLNGIDQKALSQAYIALERAAEHDEKAEMIASQLRANWIAV